MMFAPFVILFLVLWFITKNIIASIIIVIVLIVILVIFVNRMSRNLFRPRYKTYTDTAEADDEHFRIAPLTTDDDIDDKNTYTFTADGWKKLRPPKPDDIYKWLEEMREYKIKGINPATGRVKTAKIVAFDQPSTRVLIEKTGFSDIKSCEMIIPEPATPKQLSYAKDLGLIVSDDMSKRDVSCILTRYLENQDGNSSCENNEKPPEVLYRKLPEMGICISPYSSEGGVVNAYFYGCKEWEKVEFYLGVMYQRYKGSRDYDFWNLLEWSRIEHCAKQLFEDDSFMRSFRNNVSGSDLWLSYTHIDRSYKAGKMAWDALLFAGLVTGVPKRRRTEL